MKAKRVIAIVFITVLILLIPFSVITGFAEEETKSDQKKLTYADLEKATFGVLEGSVYDKIALSFFPNCKLKYYPVFSDLLVAVKNGKVDAILYNGVSINYIITKDPGFYNVDDKMLDDDYNYVIFAKNEKGEKLRDEFNQFLAKLNEENGMDDIVNYWYHAEDGVYIDYENVKGPNGVVNISISPENAPFAYVANGKLAGIFLDVVTMFCKEYGYKPNFVINNFGGGLAAVQSGKCDIMADNISYTEERAETVLYSDLLLNCYTSVNGYINIEDTDVSFWQSVKTNFRKNFIDESRYLLILKGLRNTIIISFFSVLFGSILGFLVCYLNMSRHKLLNVISKTYCVILNGTPLVVFLMIVYYVIFGNINLHPLLVAIFTLSLCFATDAGSAYEVGIRAVDKGQIEAAKSLGFTPMGVFRKVLFPQATKHFLPVYKGNIINLIKSTSIVGYVAIEDLTKMGDLIRARTFEAFSPLIALAIIYLMIVFIITKSMDKLIKKVRKQGQKKIKGVKM